MPPDQADTPARRIYFALQCAYIGEPEERAAGLIRTHDLIAEFKVATTSVLVREILDRAEAAATEDNCYFALKLARRIVNHEDSVLGGPQSGKAGSLSAARPGISERITAVHV